MAGRSGDTFKKRQKEVARAEKAREKIARRLERKLQKRAPDVDEAAGDSNDNFSESDSNQNVSHLPEPGRP